MTYEELSEYHKLKGAKPTLRINGDIDLRYRNSKRLQELEEKYAGLRALQDKRCNETRVKAYRKQYGTTKTMVEKSKLKKTRGNNFNGCLPVVFFVVLNLVWLSWVYSTI